MDKIKCKEKADGSVDIWFDADLIAVSPYILLKNSGFIKGSSSSEISASSKTRTTDMMVISQKIHTKDAIVLDIEFIKHGLIRLMFNPTKSSSQSKEKCMSDITNTIVELLNKTMVCN